MNNIFLTNIALLCFDYRYGRSVCLSQVPCVQLAADAVNSSFESFSSSFMKIKFCRCESPLTKRRLWTIIKFKRTDVVIKAILIWICPISFNNDLRSKMHQFAHRFLKKMSHNPSCWGGDTPSTPSVSRFSRPTFKTIPTPMAASSPMNWGGGESRLMVRESGEPANVIVCLLRAILSFLWGSCILSVQ